jgi:hypothetical protein
MRPQARVAYGRGVRLGGTLKNLDGQPMEGAEVQVLSRTAISPEQLVGVVRTDADGRFTYRVLAQSSRILRFVYPGSSQVLPASREVTVLARAASTIRAKPRRLLNGQAVRFSGRLRSLPAPPAGKLVELTPTEYKLLRYLLANARRVLTRDQILENVWDYTFAGNASVLETYVSYLRQKIDAVDPPLIHTVRGVGYSLRLPAGQS